MREKRGRGTPRFFVWRMLRHERRRSAQRADSAVQRPRRALVNRHAPRSAAWLPPMPCNRPRLRACALVRERPVPACASCACPWFPPCGRPARSVRLRRPRLPARNELHLYLANRAGESCQRADPPAFHQWRKYPPGEAITLPQHPTSALLRLDSRTRSGAPLDRDGDKRMGEAISSAADQGTNSGKRWRLKSPRFSRRSCSLDALCFDNSCRRRRRIYCGAVLSPGVFGRRIVAQASRSHSLAENRGRRPRLTGYVPQNASGCLRGRPSC